MRVEDHEIAALRTCARICWQRREDLRLVGTELEQVLVAWMAVGSNTEAETAAEVLAALRASDAKQAKLDLVLSQPPTPQPSAG